ncbi:RNA polymerase sigma factor [Pedobacter nyackensis]|uniref:Sigma-70, region 4 n=1 Tax=Pedobacter nyackensis TaxID=475255 RepID=A0A1W2DKC7_9SPHI|nr:sigma-70 family RNA polymerase sigma factor [Pedobacter nyackensis]SMC97944.1 Sigma-70, region 4 [Pedobacter nyackensis]
MSKKQLLEERTNSLHSLWWEAMCLGDKEAFLDIYKTLYRSLGCFGLRVHSDPDVVTDSLNQVFLDIWEKHEFLPRVANVEAYLRTTLKHKILKKIARQQKLDNIISMIGKDEDLLDIPYEELIVKIESDELVKRQLNLALKKLTPQQLKLIQLRFYEGLSYESVAENCGLTVRTAYNTIYSALKSLRQHLQL